MNATYVVLALLTGAITGAVFRFFEVPIPAPPSLAGVMGIVGIYVGYKLVEYAGVQYDIVEALGL
ncbi:XapX domain-containing protein [Salarchaeum sp. JOR-1]|uniref:XapX domain-containing protein n=1 Tax=Salarchaeum sp. JOR-1 TaxID=2599399 RepID=UPI001198847B|nr:DUF1427 family protein [Salarchaeum sp. JOR-1]QDX41630.1 XapX domain-containing protein [Salarchaeum sp. JOR-1]